MSLVSIGSLIDLFLVVGAVFALWKGGAAERIAASAVIADVIIGNAALFFDPAGESLIRLGTDGVSALALLFVTIRYAAPWMGGVMFFFAAQFALHSYYLVMERPRDYFHALVNNLNWSGVAWCLVIGTTISWIARRRAAPEALEVAP